ncbi:MAG: UvrB/UvrC motif-containing protein [Pirellulaceae bacterium]|nr:UvrB/UvrC motif-containing protein [Pirellulaceae bacterium]
MSEPSLDSLLKSWKFDPLAVNVRKGTGTDDREVLLMRVDLGILQMETSGRPDGEKPAGRETYYAYLQELAEEDGKNFVLNEQQCQEADREFVQYYHRRVCWLSLQQFHRAIQDAEHTLQFMDFCKTYSPDDEWTFAHEQYRPFVLFHHTQAKALASFDQFEDEEFAAQSAIRWLDAGLKRLEEVFQELEIEEQFEEDELVLRLRGQRDSIRKQYGVGQTLFEKLSVAIEAEDFESAARIRDELAKFEVNELDS